MCSCSANKTLLAVESPADLDVWFVCTKPAVDHNTKELRSTAKNIYGHMIGPNAIESHFNQSDWTKCYYNDSAASTAVNNNIFLQILANCSPDISAGADLIVL